MKIVGRLRAANGYVIVSHRLGPEFSSRSLHVGFVVDETESRLVFSLGFSLFPCHIFHSTISLYSSHFVSFHFIRPCDGASDVVGHHPCYPQIFNKGASSLLILRPGPLSHTS